MEVAEADDPKPVLGRLLRVAQVGEMAARPSDPMTVATTEQKAVRAQPAQLWWTAEVAPMQVLRLLPARSNSDEALAEARKAADRAWSARRERAPRRPLLPPREARLAFRTPSPSAV